MPMPASARAAPDAAAAPPLEFESQHYDGHTINNP